MFKKNLTLGLLLVGLSASLFGQFDQFWGMTYSGGAYGAGSIIKINDDATGFATEYSFVQSAGANPAFTKLCLANNGLMYGMTTQGGAFNRGVLFSFDPTTNISTELITFDGPTNGANPSGSLIVGANGQLYGMTRNGGLNDFGVLFSFNTANNTLTKILDFAGTSNGKYPHGDLFLANNGFMYGMTREGGTLAYGVLFRFDPATNTYLKLVDFNFTNGAFPYGGVTQAANGLLYGVTSQGGNFFVGTFFRLDPATNVYTKLYNFDGANSGSYPHGTPIQAPNGRLLGVTLAGGANNNGMIYSFNLNTNIAIGQFSFNGVASGQYPQGSLMMANNNLLYGVTSQGGALNLGTFFSFNYNGSVFTKLYDFFGSFDGGNPLCTMTQAPNGKLYGLAATGGASNGGSLFSWDITNAALVKHVDFNRADDGAAPSGGLIQASNGKMYGLTAQGGNFGFGALFEYDPATQIYTKHVDFDDFVNGSYPLGTLMQASNGLLYGMTKEGGSSDLGVLFSFDPATNTFTKLLDFLGNSNGSLPYGSLMQASNGLLYGMTSAGGTFNLGTFFSFNTNTNTQSIVFHFNGTLFGSLPYGTPMQASDGNIYGTASSGGANSRGIVFRYDPVGLTIANLHDFNTSDGWDPRGKLEEAPNGKLYGMTFRGGANDLGVLFNWNPANSQFTKNLDFTGTANGSRPQGGLELGTNGKLYGMTQYGGTNDRGVIFNYDPSNNALAVMRNLSFADGSNPPADLTPVILPPIILTDPVSQSACEGDTVTFLVTATGASSYQWEHNGNVVGGNSPVLTLNNVTLADAGDYVCIAFNVLGVSDTSAIATLTVSPAPNVSISGNLILCPGQTTVLTASGGSTYLWSTGETTASITVSNIGNYIVTGTNVGGCSDTAQAAVVAPGGNIIYVNDNAVGLNNGTSWPNAFTDLQSALAIATPGRQIWVAQGTYRPTAGLNRSIFFNIPSGVIMYGGFPDPGSCLLSDRDWDAYPTILSGDIGVAGAVNDNSYLVVRMLNVNTNTVFDGFYVVSGNSITNGGGLEVVSNASGQVSSPNVNNCRFNENKTTGRGGGVFVTALNNGTCNPVFNRCNFYGNSSSNDGGGLSTSSTGGGVISVTVSYCDFAYNFTQAKGGGISNWVNIGGTTTMTLSNSVFTANSAVNNGGAVWNYARNGSFCTSSIINCTFQQNTAANGPAIFNHSLGGSVYCLMSGCTFTLNIATKYGAVTAYSDGAGNVTTLLSQCSFYYNSGSDGGAMANVALNNSTCNVTSQRCLMQSNTGKGAGSFTYCSGPLSIVNIDMINNVFWANNSTANGGGVATNALSNGVINHSMTNCTFYANTAATTGAAVHNGVNATGGTSTINAKNCIFWANACANPAINKAFFGNSVFANTAVTYSLLDNATCALNENGPGGFTCANTISGNPLFIDAANGNLRLNSPSPAIDVATAVGAPNIDFDNAPRPYGNGYDMGAFERQAPRPEARMSAEPTATAQFGLPEATIFPNPNDGRFSVVLSEAFKAEALVQVLNANGQICGTAMMQPGTEQTFDLSELPSSFYIVKIVCGDEVIVKKVMRM